MHPVIFPNCIVAEPILRTLSFLFSQPVVLFHPAESRIPEYLKKARSAGLADIRAPGDEMEAELVWEKKNILTWAMAHEGADLSGIYLKNRIAPSFTRDTVSGIASRIRQNKEETLPQPPDRGFSARLFLLLAQDYQTGELEMSEGLSRLQEKENRMLEALHGEEKQKKRIPASSGGAGYPIVFGPERAMAFMRAWSGLYLQEQEKARSCGENPDTLQVFVTLDKEAFSLVAEAGFPVAETGTIHPRGIETKGGSEEWRKLFFQEIRDIISSDEKDAKGFSQKVRQVPAGRDDSLGIRLNTMVVHVGPQTLFSAFLEETKGTASAREKPGSMVVLAEYVA